MSDNDNYFKILEKLTEMNGSIGELKASVDNVKEDIVEIKKEDREQNKLLAEHIQGVKTQAARLDVEIEARKEQHDQTLILIESHKQDNKDQFKSHEDKAEARLQEMSEKLDQVSFLPNLGIMIRKAILWIGAPAGALYGIGKLLGWF